MSKVKVSKAQMDVLRRMVQGEAIEHNIGTRTTYSYLVKGHIRDKVAKGTFDSLNRKNLIAATGIESTGANTVMIAMGITPEGRAVVQAADTAGEG